ncbi:MAG TPA: hypothetical protein VGN98_11050, partial [Tianweitania sediminis]|nr:hypothetical protein [Tianweitania sediminis]
RTHTAAASVMRGRLSDVFAVTPVAAGASVLGYFGTASWEKKGSETACPLVEGQAPVQRQSFS